MPPSREISPEEALTRTFDAVFDIRSAPSDAPIPGAHRISYTELVDGTEFAETDAEVLVMCDIGVRSKLAVTALEARGFSNVWSLAGGADALRLHLASTHPETDGATDMNRYDRQLRLTGFGIAGQTRLANASVVVVGAGGLGSPVLTYLTAAGVGRLTIVDPDVVELSNLHRQPIYRTDDVGRRKVDAAADHLSERNPDVDVTMLAVAVDTGNASSIIDGADVVVDATDSFDARHSLNRASVERGVPLVYGSVYGYEGQFAVFDAEAGPCYRCVFPTEPTGDAALDCATIGVLGVVTSVIGSLQASAALQIAAGVSHDLFESLTLFDSRTARFDRMKVKKRDDCEVCGHSGQTGSPRTPSR